MLVLGRDGVSFYDEQMNGGRISLKGCSGCETKPITTPKQCGEKIVVPIDLSAEASQE